MTLRAHLAAITLALSLAPGLARAAEPVAINPDSFFPEGPVWSDGKLYYVEYGKDRVMVWDGSANTQVWVQAGCGANGLAILDDRSMWVACNAGNSIVRVTRDGRTLEERKTDAAGKPFNGPNDFVVDAKGGVYFTSSGDYDLAKPIDGRVYYIAPGGGAVSRVADHLWFANGVALADGGRKLLVAETLSHRVLSYDVNADGTVGDARLFARMQDLDRSPVEDNVMLGGPDSMRTDREGNVYIAQYGAARLLIATPAGKLLRILSVPPEYRYITNLAFSPDEATVYVTAARDQDNAPYPGAVFKLENR